MKGRQLALGVQLSESASFEAYFAGRNAQTLAVLREYPDAAAGNGVFLFGAAATGKTHLLHALVRDAAARQRRVAYLPLREIAGDGPQVLAGLEQHDLICADDVDAVLDDAGWALALLRLLDARRTAHRHVVLAARAAPDRIGAGRPDLLTRLASCILLALKPLPDAQRGALLRSRARARGLELADDAVRWLLTHLPRDPATLIAALDRLDHASLAEQRRLTLPFVQQTVLPLIQRELALPSGAPAEPG